MVYGISMGVQRGEPELQREVETILRKRASAIGAILRGYGVPLV